MSAGDIEPLFPNMPVVRPNVDQKNALALQQRRSDLLEPWMDEALYQARSGRRTAWIFACILLVVVGAQAAAIAIMLPLKSVVPYTVTVDKQTGYVEMSKGVQLNTDLKDDEAVVHSMLAQYILNRETFDTADFQDRYERVALWSLGPARDEYVNQYQSGGAALAAMRPGSVVRVTVKRIELLSKDNARVRFATERRDPGAAPVVTDYQSIVSFRFTGAPMKMEDRFLNPLGFQVTAYRRDTEGPPAPVVAEPAPMAPAAASPLAPEAQSGVSVPGSAAQPTEQPLPPHIRATGPQKPATPAANPSPAP